MTTPARPVCQWCRQPITDAVAWWDGQPQCPDPFRCDRQIAAKEKP